ncbi:hypothetical protein [Corynebacterium halotolerans]|uniref:Uncharacterized protein n=1 Tax=Corynebacterium halotolerans YIM 70093 = DSM 44683 TaxID=1121362 RepID=M1NND4_9CORY|nr:hypothetical protein [Corynebacterium halotolerans]AGF72873.1 hypothetical protein A605_09355 [Corynebacterium halotolerans YIM 70093 = DSM 44683]
MTDPADRIRKIVAVVAVVALAALLIVGIFDDRTAKPMPPNGDTLGMDAGESFDDYRRRAADSLAAAPADEEAFALVTFTDPLSPAEAEEVLEPVGRVNAMIIELASPFPLPEPVEGETRADVFHRELDRIAHSLSGVGNVPVPEHLDAVIIWDTGEVLRGVAEDEDVAAVEALPPDAAWGRFGVRPVEVER